MSAAASSAIDSTAIAGEAHARPVAPLAAARRDDDSAGAGAAIDPRAAWRDYDRVAERLSARFAALYRWRYLDHQQPLRLQQGVPVRLRKPYAVRVAYTDWGREDAPVVICLGGVANTAMRFSFLAADLAPYHRVVCMDWVGRGQSGWLADEREYRMETYVAQLRQLVTHLGRGPVTLLGSSMGGSIAIEFAARFPRAVSRLVLNDIGPHMPAARRRRRAEALSRFYVFRTPADILRRVGASAKNDGPVSEQVRHFLTHHQTAWSPADGGRIYRHDLRAMANYRREATRPVDQWDAWNKVTCPALLVHGVESDALLPPTIARMRREAARPLTVMHVPGTGHTPVLCDRNQGHFIARWLGGDIAPAEFTALPARPRWAWQTEP